MYEVVKRYGHELGLSTTFRNWRSDSHCGGLHGYALAFEFVFRAPTLDDRNWLVDFGALKPLKAWLVENHDHRMYVAIDDPHLEEIAAVARLTNTAHTVVPQIGMEAFAQRALHAASRTLGDYNRQNKTRVVAHSCTVWEHPNNAARYTYDTE